MARILIIEDEPVSRGLLRRILAWNAHDLNEATDGESGLALATELKPELILMDLSLPLLDGWAALVQMRQRGLQMPIVALTAHALRGDRERVLAAGFDGYISKPIDVRTFNQTLESYLPCQNPR